MSPGSERGRPAPRSAIERQAFAGFFSAIVIVALVAFIGYASARRFIETSRSVAHAHAVLVALQGIQAALNDAISAQRGYLITSSENYTNDRETAISDLETSVQLAKELIVDNAQQARLQLLEQQLAKRRALLDEIVVLQQTEGFEAVRERMLAGDTRRADSDLRETLAELETEENRLLSARTAADLRAARWMIGALLGFIVTVVALLAWLFNRIRTGTAELERTDAAVKRYAEEVHDLYNRAPCGYHSLDENGVFVNINDTELQWLGYTREELIGRKHFIDLVTEPGRSGFAHGFSLYKERGQTSDVELDVIRKDGSQFHVLLNSTAIKDENGRFVASRTTLFDITLRQQKERQIAVLNEQLRQQTAQLEAANKELESFSYSVSHDLRAPLRRIDGYAQMLEEDCAAQVAGDGKRYIDVIRRSCQRMATLIDDLLEFSKLSRGEIARRGINMTVLASRAAEEALAACQGKRPQLIIETLPDAHADPALIQHVWGNLLANAVKYSSKREEPLVRVSGVRHNGSVEYHVADNGVGFDMRYADKLFGVFQRLHATDEYEGTGVGLAIVQRIVTRHGGRVWARGEPDRGATFSFSLPAEDA